jgi:hypothetical protein
MLVSYWISFCGGYRRRRGAGKASTGKVNLVLTTVALGEVLDLLPEGADPKGPNRLCKKSLKYSPAL